MRGSTAFSIFLSLVLTFDSSPALAQTGQPAAPEPPLRRWLDVQQVAVYLRYRFTENNRDVTTANQLQYRDAIRARINADAEKRYTLNFGIFSGNAFIITWNNLGVGNDTTFVGKTYFRQLYGSAEPIKGLELQYGGLYLNRGEGDEWATYDDDGYVAGARVSIRRPKALYLDEITVTRAGIGPQAQPNLFDRGDQFTHPDYTQVLGLKHFTPVVSGSLEYNRQLGSDLVRGAVTLRLPAAAPVRAIRYEQYHRFATDEIPAEDGATKESGSGFGLWAERPVTKYARVQGGYVSIDRFYGGWNADRMLTGRRFYATAVGPIWGPLSYYLFASAALDETYAVANHRRFEAHVQWDVLNSLRKTGVF